MDRIQRITEMEMRLNRATFLLKEMDKTLDGYLMIQEDLHALSAYYASQDWKDDFEADEAGLLPANLIRGILSEDGIDDLLQQETELKQRLRKLLQEPESGMGKNNWT